MRAFLRVFLLSALFFMPHWLFAQIPGTWQSLGPDDATEHGFSTGGANSISLVFNGSVPYVAYQDVANGYGATVKRFDGDAWVTVGTEDFSAGVVYSPTLAFNGSTPYVAFGDAGRDGNATVMRYDGTNWVNVGDPGFSAGTASQLSLVINGGTPYLAYRDGGNGNKATVMKYDGTSWIYVGAAGFSPGGASFTSLAFIGSTPYVAYVDENIGQKATVMKFDGTDWVTVGTPGFSTASVTFVSMAVDGDAPFVAYTDGGVQNKATVMKYGGYAWAEVGTAGFSSSTAVYNSLAFSGSTPYLAFIDYGNGYKPTVMKFNGSEWVTVGAAGFSANVVSYPSLAIDDGTLFVAYANDSGGAFVKYFEASKPAISTTGTLSALSTTAGTASASTSFDVSGINMLGPITLSAPRVFELSLDNAAFSSSIEVGAAGTIAATPVYVRLRATAVAGTYAGDIILTSSGAERVSVAMAASTVNASAPDVLISSTAGDPTSANPIPVNVSFSQLVQNFEQAGATVTGGTLDNFETGYQFKLSSTIGSAGSGTGQLNWPNYMATDGLGNLYVADMTNSRIEVFQPDGSFVLSFGTNGTGNGQFKQVASLAIGTNGDIYVVDATNKRIQVFDKNGIFIRKFNASSGSFVPYSIALDAAGNIYVSFENSSVINIYSNSGTFLRRIGTSGSGDGQIGKIAGIALDAAGAVYVADGANHRVVVFNNDGTFLRNIGRGGTGNGEFGALMDGLAVDAAGNVFVVDGGNSRVQVFDHNGSFLAKTTTTFNKPAGVTVDGSGTVYVAENSGNKIDVLKFEKTYTLNITPTTPTVKVDVAAGVAANSSGVGNTAATQFFIQSSLPFINTTGTLTALTTYAGTASPSAMFNVSGVNLSEGILITPPAGFEVSTDDATYTSVLTIGASGTVTSTPVYIRLAAATAAGSYGGDIVLSSSGATDIHVATVNSTVNALPVMSTEGTLTALTTMEGAASSSTSFNISGVNMVAGILITPPPGFELSTDDATFTPTLTLGAAGNIAGTTIYIRLTDATAAGEYGGDIILSSNEAADVHIPMPASTVTALIAATVTTGTATNITATTVTLHGSVSADGGTNVTEKGIFFSTGQKSKMRSPGVADSHTGVGPISVDVTGLTPGTTYYYKAYAINAAGVTYGDDAKSFTTTLNPVISAAGTLSARHATFGSASATAAFTVSGTNLIAGIVVKAPTGFEVSDQAATGFANTVTIGGAGTITSAPVYIRLKAGNNAGDYSGDVTLHSDKVGTVNLAMPKSTVAPYPLTIAANNTSKTYGEILTTNDASTAYTIRNGTLQNGNTVKVALTYGAGAAAGDHAGVYAAAITPSLVSGAGGFQPGNYIITYEKGDIVVNKATLTITVAAQNKSYGADNPALTFTYSGFIPGDTEAGSISTKPVVSSTALRSSAAGTYPITAGGAASANYTLVYQPGVLTVDKALLSVTADSKTRAYGQANPALTVHYNGFVNGDTEADLIKPATAFTDATPASSSGTYPITAGGASSANYTLVYQPGVLTVDKVLLSVTADSKTRAYGQANPALTVHYNGFVNGDTEADLIKPATAFTDATPASSSGTYPITVGGAASANYTVVYKPGVLTVDKALLSVTADSKTRTYGQANPALTVHYNGFVNGDTEADLIKPATAFTDATPASSSGTYSITAGGASSANYTVVYQPGVLTVDKVLLSVTADSKTRAYGQANPALTVHYNGFVNGDTETDLIKQATALTDASQTSLPGSYPIVAGGAQSANYYFKYISGTLTVSARANAGLAGLVISSGSLSPVFSTTTQAYYASVIVAQVKLTAVAADAAATIRINGVIVRSGTVSAPLALAVGNNTINVEVTANDGTTRKNYVLTIYRAAPADLISPANIMSPNGDGKNDAWVVKDIQLYPNNKVTVYDRAGREIYAKRGYNNDWDGTLSGAPLAQGTYYYIIDLGEGNTPIKGFITILKNQ